MRYQIVVSRVIRHPSGRQQSLNLISDILKLHNGNLDGNLIVKRADPKAEEDQKRYHQLLGMRAFCESIPGCSSHSVPRQETEDQVPFPFFRLQGL
jgi:hypothetical protein